MRGGTAASSNDDFSQESDDDTSQESASESSASGTSMSESESSSGDSSTDVSDGAPAVSRQQATDIVTGKLHGVGAIGDLRTVDNNTMSQLEDIVGIHDVKVHIAKAPTVPGCFSTPQKRRAPDDPETGRKTLKTACAHGVPTEAARQTCR